ncbi:MAG: glutamate-1-semialdehyde 2,1-aminomutase [Clostridiaceae bacterium]|jgi:glutamate-1-semialdehyde 2,1-aminomutase|nr:glutamate-1-semialdehyde 2,1-aminomutase [Clostridiaceae bacterium]
MKDNGNEIYFERAKRVLVGGVNSPVRAFKHVGGTPPVIRRGKGARLFDVEGKEYIDFVCSWGAAILGHAREEITESIARTAADGASFGALCDKEAELAELVLSAFPDAGKVRLVSSGTEAVMTAVRLARGVTGRSKIIKFSGCYHGHSDAVLIEGGSGAAQFSAYGGLTAGMAADTLVAEFNDEKGFNELFCANKDTVAAVILEIIPCNMGVVLPEPAFLKIVEGLCRRYGALLIADEVITGFRFGYTGAARLYGLNPDITTLGKIIGGGLPVGAIIGRDEVMNCLAPEGKVYQAGTLSGNPISVAAGISQLSILKNTPAVYEKLARLSAHLNDRLKTIFSEEANDNKNICKNRAVKGGMKAICVNGNYAATELYIGKTATVNSIGSLHTVFIGRTAKVRNYADAKACLRDGYAEYFRNVFGKGFYIPPSQFEACFLSVAHTDDDIDAYADAVKAGL